MKIDGKQLANEILETLKAKLATEVEKNTASNQPIFGCHPKMPPTLAVVLVGNNPASLSYIKQKQLSAEKIGAKVILKQFPDTISQNSLITQISQLNTNLSVNGIIVQRPLLLHIDKNIVNESVVPSKDIDGFHPQSKYKSPVALAVLYSLYYCYTKSLKNFKLPIKGSDARYKISNLDISNSLQISNFKFQIFHNWLNTQKILLLGRGETGGKPIANTMDKLKIKYYQAHSKTKNILNEIKIADIIISAIGKPNFITGDMIKKGAICIGIGISKIDQKSNNLKLKIKNLKLSNEDLIQTSKLVGDFDEESIASKSSYYTPTPGGIGPLTVAFLLKNLIDASKNYLNT